jgi:hypothetical protein
VRDAMPSGRGPLGRKRRGARVLGVRGGKNLQSPVVRQAADSRRVPSPSPSGQVPRTDPPPVNAPARGNHPPSYTRSSSRARRIPARSRDALFLNNAGNLGFLSESTDRMRVSWRTSCRSGSAPASGATWHGGRPCPGSSFAPSFLSRITRVSVFREGRPAEMRVFFRSFGNARPALDCESHRRSGMLGSSEIARERGDHCRPVRFAGS